MLKLNEDLFAPNAATYYEDDPSLESNQTSIHIQIILQGAVDISTFARLDPATPWVVLNAELNEQLGLGANGPNVEMRTAAGPMAGTLERYPIVLAAQDGQSLEIDATLFVCDEWQRGNFLGYTGFLERIRFAVDPSSRLFYFGFPSG